ncbi:MAG: hydantoinase/oxoprolinase family protein [Rhodobacteraceae bacterium]|nr:hydantoinase/oxoprolinase family protein [Paracoccaceae bacterium]
MTLLLGVDTGGTYTDAVIIRDEAEVLASAKALTTRGDLAIGVGQAVASVLETSGVAAGDITLSSLSTTLATNALVEGQGGRIALILIGFSEYDFAKHGLREALKGDPYVIVSGGHNHAGNEAKPLDTDALRAFIQTHGADVDAFAIGAQFATRNPAHEQAAAQLVADETGRPVSASHHLSAKLGGPRRALTALLNARLVSLTHRLIDRAEHELAAQGIRAPMMIVRGDGALMSAEQARERPIETILSGPAASIVGASWLTKAQNALVSDIGGTTTDVALLSDGKPAIDPNGARVGPFRTMVEAVGMRTHGLGGDSAVHLVREGLSGGLHLGPTRWVPVSLLAHDAPDVVLPALDKASRATVSGEHDGFFVRAVPGMPRAGLSAREETVLARVGDGVVPMSTAIQTRLDTSALRRLVERGIVQQGGITPSDAAHVLGLASAWNAEAAEMALTIAARRRSGSGETYAPSPQVLAERIIAQLHHQTGLALLESAFEHDGYQGPADLARHVLTQRGLDHARGAVKVDLALGVPVVGLGASAPTYYPPVGDRLGCDMILPKHAGVANAIGAVVGRISVRKSVTITAQGEGRYRAHMPDSVADFLDEDAARQHVQDILTELAESEVRGSGAGDVKTGTTYARQVAKIEGREMFVEALVTVEASGRPRVAVG